MQYSKRLFVLAAVLCLALSACGGSGKKKATTTTVKPTATTVQAETIPTAVTIHQTVTDSSDPDKTPKVTQWIETASQTGSYRATAQDGSDDEAFASNLRTLSSELLTDGKKSLTVAANTSLGGPDASVRPQTVLAQYVGALADAADPVVQPTTLVGRSALHAVFDVGGSSGFDHADVTVDAQTLTPLLIDTTKASKPYIRWETTSFDAAPNVSAVSYVIPQKPDEQVYKSDAGFVETQPDLVKTQVGYAPLVPSVLPAGMSSVRVLTHAGKGEPTGVDDKNPQSQDVVVMQYALGWRTLLVTTRASGGDPGKWQDPFADVDNQYGSAPQPFAITNGAMGTAKGQTVVSPNGVPHLWVAGTSLTYTSAGPFSAVTQAAAANSLQ